MKSWERFEDLAANYLNQTFGAYARFELEGGADSTVPDILVTAKSGKQFYIEAKHCPAQCGQFVLIPNDSTRSFVFSGKNSTRPNEYTDAIIKHMNADFESYKNAGTAGEEIVMINGSEIFADWITLTYRNKGVLFFITNDYAIIPIEDFSKYFSVTATYRVKRSGSSHVGKGKINAVAEYISQSYSVTEVEAGDNEKKLFVSSKRDLENQRFEYDSKTYMFSWREDKGMYEVRKLSDTANANVIFSINLKPSIRGLSNEQFIERL